MGMWWCVALLMGVGTMSTGVSGVKCLRDHVEGRLADALRMWLLQTTVYNESLYDTVPGQSGFRTTYDHFESLQKAFRAALSRKPSRFQIPYFLWASKSEDVCGTFATSCLRRGPCVRDRCDRVAYNFGFQAFHGCMCRSSDDCNDWPKIGRRKAPPVVYTKVTRMTDFWPAEAAAQRKLEVERGDWDIPHLGTAATIKARLTEKNFNEKERVQAKMAWPNDEL